MVVWLSGSTEDAFPETDYGSVGELCKMDLSEGTVRRARKNLKKYDGRNSSSTKGNSGISERKKGMPGWTRKQLKLTIHRESYGVGRKFRTGGAMERTARK